MMFPIRIQNKPIRVNWNAGNRQLICIEQKICIQEIYENMTMTIEDRQINAI